MPVEDWHVAVVAERMRQADRDEVLALSGLTPREALDQSLAQAGPRWCGLLDGEPAAIFGVVPVTALSGTGVAWLLGTPLLEKHWRTFAKASRPLADELLARYDVLMNVLHADNRIALRWLEWMGATLRRNGQLVYFELRANHAT